MSKDLPAPVIVRVIEPPIGRFAMRVWSLWGIVIVSAIYLGNFTFGIDLIPDNLPLIGNLDEVAAFVIGQQAYMAIKTGSSRLFRRV